MIVLLAFIVLLIVGGMMIERNSWIWDFLFALELETMSPDKAEEL